MNTKKLPVKSKKVRGGREWADITVNCLIGCSHDCRYCYAKAMAIGLKRMTPPDWKNERPNDNTVNKGFRKRKSRIMFPSTHDITPLHLNECMGFLEHILIPGNEVLVVLKPHLDCIKVICERFQPYKDKILFRFTIGSSDSGILKFWEPNAPDFQERLSALEWAFAHGFQTSISCEPMLDDNVADVIQQAAPLVTNSIWLGKANKLLGPYGRLALNGENDPATITAAHQLISIQSDENILDLYSRYKDNPKIKWKAGIKKIVGLEVSKEPGLDM